ncbi:MAG: Gfo/Idh/MocA family oxidoreductase, partial [Roseiflexaceae bacterium]
MERVRIGLIGCGSMARYHGRIFTQQVPEAEIAALVDPSEANLTRFVSEIFPGGAAP